MWLSESEVAMATEVPMPYGQLSDLVASFVGANRKGIDLPAIKKEKW